MALSFLASSHSKTSGVPAVHLGMYYMKRNRTADAWKSLVMIGSVGKMGHLSHHTVRIHHSVQLLGSVSSPRNNTLHPNTPCWVSCALWTPSWQAKISARHAFTRGLQVLLRPCSRPAFVLLTFDHCRYQPSRLEIEAFPRGRASDAC